MFINCYPCFYCEISEMNEINNNNKIYESNNTTFEHHSKKNCLNKHCMIIL